ncbi:RNI-like protein [Ascodesmis nigricans]|uniref:RNI-like protein n=1 Tax=Ascodesmis nigricans TaxID=341454 RepID=A0A4S2MVP7_9PEZI|nr:RNI-like protein [Ascodesmis nigricans]
MHRRRNPSAPLPPPPSPHHLIQTFESTANPSRPIRPSPLTTQNGIPLDLLDRLRSFPLFQSAPESFLTAVASHLRPQLHSPRDYILTEGENAKAMYWLVRGAVAVTSRDGESTYAELRPGAFFGEIAILMNIPRTATIIARSRCLLVVLTKEALQRELPRFPEVERAIREEAEERLEVLIKKKREREKGRVGGVKRAVDEDRDVEMHHRELERERRGTPSPPPMMTAFHHQQQQSPKRPTTPTVVSPINGVNGMMPGGHWASGASALGNVAVNIRQLLMELPLFSELPNENLHFLGLSAHPKTFPPFTNILQQNSIGREIFFIVGGEVEVVDESDTRNTRVKARLKKGQYFGEVAALSLAPKRIATVRSVTQVECLVISNDVLNELWKRCPPGIRAQVEATARTRMDDVDAMDIDTPDQSLSPTVQISRPKSPSLAVPDAEPCDPDPYVPDFELLVRTKSRRGSLTPPQPGTVSSTSPGEESPPPPQLKIYKHTTQSIPDYPVGGVKKIRIQSTGNSPSRFNTGRLPDQLLVSIFQKLELDALMRLRAVCTHWSRLLSTSPQLLHVLDLAPYNRVITDHAITSAIAPFVGQRPRIIDISNCFHLSDAAFTTLAVLCGTNVVDWRMKSVWDITAPAILEMSNRAKGLKSIDLSNCRKVSDTLLARIVGWPPHPHPHPHPATYPPPGTIIGCPSLSSLTLSYCKHLTDRTMSHLATHASQRLTHLNLTRCTTITDSGFHSWSLTTFPSLRTLILSDCTYLTDSSIIYLCSSAPYLTHLDLSFCCALSDTALEVIALRCQGLRELRVAFCGSAVSDASLRCVGSHLWALRRLSVRGCVRVTGVGVEEVLENCELLEWFDVSQCVNLREWDGHAFIFFIICFE